ncbi:hypothetical protein ACU4GD_10380 [Cupriavidus basilensis]
MTISIGVTHLVSGDTLTTALIKADEALYDSKRTGKDQVHVPPGTLPARRIAMTHLNLLCAAWLASACLAGTALAQSSTVVINQSGISALGHVWEQCRHRQWPGGDFP